MFHNFLLAWDLSNVATQLCYITILTIMSEMYSELHDYIPVISQILLLASYHVLHV